MPLELDGKPYRLTKEENAKYSKNMIFRVGTQHIRVNHDPELPRVEVSPVHIMPEYRHSKMVDGLKEGLGKLVYFNSKNYNTDSKRDEYSPARIPFPNTGYIKSDDAEMNFFLDNHPNNEVVKANPEHPNFSATTDTYFSTYMKERKRNSMVETLKLGGELSLRLLDPQEYSFEQLKGLAQQVQKTANDYHMAHKLYSLDDKDPEDLRSELARLAATYPFAMKDLMESKRVDYLEWVNKLYEVKLIQIVNNEWFMVEKGGARGLPLMRVLEGQDAIHSLVDWFQTNDTRGSKFKLLKEKFQELDARRKLKTVKAEGSSQT